MKVKQTTINLYNETYDRKATVPLSAVRAFNPDLMGCEDAKRRVRALPPQETMKEVAPEGHPHWSVERISLPYQISPAGKKQDPVLGVQPWPF